MALAQSHFRGRNDDGTLATATYIAALNTNWDQAVDTAFRPRFALWSNAYISNGTYKLYYSHNSGAYTEITASSSVVKMVNDANSIPDKSATVQRITSGAYTGGECYGYTDVSITGNIDHSGATYPRLAELEFCIQIIGADVSDLDTIDLRIRYGGGAPLGTYSETPTLTVDKSAKNINANYGTLTLTGQAASVVIVGSPQNINANYGTLTLTGQQGSVVAWVTPVTDRAASDLVARNAKAFLNVADWKRIDGNISIVQALILSLIGVTVTLNSLDTPATTTFPTADEINELVENIERLRIASGLGLPVLSYDYLSGAAATAPDYIIVNAWEDNLKAMYDRLPLSTSYMIACGVATSGQSHLWQARFRG